MPEALAVYRGPFLDGLQFLATRQRLAHPVGQELGEDDGAFFQNLKQQMLYF